MSTSLTPTIDITRDRIELWKRTFCKGATDDELAVFVQVCIRTGLSPEARQIYMVKRPNRKTGRDDVTIQTGIDGYRLVADRTDKYAGNDDPKFDDEHNPRKATVTVYKLIGSVRCPFTASARWDQYYPGDGQGFMWRKMPHLMLGKCAEALALRKAFPAELSGIYTKEEMDQADKGDVVIGEEEFVTVTPVESKPLPPASSPERTATIYTGTPGQQESIENWLRKANFPEELWSRIHSELLNRPSSDLAAVVRRVRAEADL